MTNDSRITDVTDMSVSGDRQLMRAAGSRGSSRRIVLPTFFPQMHTHPSDSSSRRSSVSDITSCILVYLDTDRALESAARSCTCMAFAFVASASLPKAFSPSCS